MEKEALNTITTKLGRREITEEEYDLIN